MEEDNTVDDRQLDDTLIQVCPECEHEADPSHRPFIFDRWLDALSAAVRRGLKIPPKPAECREMREDHWSGYAVECGCRSAIHAR